MLKKNPNILTTCLAAKKQKKKKKNTHTHTHNKGSQESHILTQITECTTLINPLFGSRENPEK